MRFRYFKHRILDARISHLFSFRLHHHLSSYEDGAGKTLFFKLWIFSYHPRFRKTGKKSPILLLLLLIFCSFCFKRILASNILMFLKMLLKKKIATRLSLSLFLPDHPSPDHKYRTKLWSCTEHSAFSFPKLVLIKKLRDLSLYLNISTYILFNSFPSNTSQNMLRRL